MAGGGSTLSNVLAILDVGHGNSAVLFVGGEVVVFDVGQRSGLLEFLSEHDVRNVKTVFLSHADKDHIGALTGLLSSQIVEIHRVVLNCDGLKKSAAWDDLVYELDRAHNAGELQFDVALVEGDLEEYDNVKVEVIAPSRYLAAKGPGSTDRQERRITSNSMSAVIRISRDNRPIAVLPGDVDGTGLENLIESNVDAEAPVLVFPHHGGNPGATGVAKFVRRICELIKPQAVVFSIGRGRYATPNPELVRVLRQCLPDVRIVCTQLSQHCSESVPAVSPTHLTNAFALGRRDGCCCGGTVLIDLNKSDGLQPDYDGHSAFIEASVATPLCKK